MISQTVEYALRAIVTLADHHDKSCTTQQISDLTQVPIAYLSKVLQSLARGGLLRSRRGLYGGFSLQRPPDELTLWDVVQAVDPLERIEACPLNLVTHDLKLCPLHQKLDDTLGMLEQIFKETTLSQLTSDVTGLKPLCEIPQDNEPE